MAEVTAGLVVSIYLSGVVAGVVGLWAAGLTKWGK